jgi:hypothetical protein
MRGIRFMPNPNRNRDDTLSTTPVGASAKDGEILFNTKKDVGKNGAIQFRCVECHTNPSGGGAFAFDGLIGQPMKAVQLRGLYKRTGRRPTANNTNLIGSKVRLQTAMVAPCGQLGAAASARARARRAEVGRHYQSRIGT